VSTQIANPRSLLHPIVRCSCGNSTFIRVTPMRGRWIETLEWKEDGTIEREATTDGLEETGIPKTIRCDKCGKRRPNPEAPNNSITGGVAVPRSLLLGILIDADYPSRT